MITAEEVDKALAAQLIKLREPIYHLRRRQIETLIAEPRLAKGAARRGIAIPTLLDAEVTTTRGLVTEQEVEAFYQANKALLRGHEASLREQIRTYLQSQKLARTR